MRNNEQIERESEDKFNHQIDRENRNNNMTGAVGENMSEEELHWIVEEIEVIQEGNLRQERDRLEREMVQIRTDSQEQGMANLDEDMTPWGTETSLIIGWNES